MMFHSFAPTNWGNFTSTKYTSTQPMKELRRRHSKQTTVITHCKDFPLTNGDLHSRVFLDSSVYRLCDKIFVLL